MSLDFEVAVAFQCQHSDSHLGKFLLKILLAKRTDSDVNTRESIY